MPTYKNTSKFYKLITIDGKRVNVPPNSNVFSDRELNLEIYEYLEKINDDVKPPTSQKENKQKIEVIDKSQYEKLEKAIISLHKKINDIKTLSNDDVKKVIQEFLDETPKIEEEELERIGQKLKNLEQTFENNPISTLTENIKDLQEKFQNIDRRQHIIKNAIDEVNQAVINLEKYVYEGDYDNLPIVVVDEESKDDKIDDGNDISIMDIINGG